MGVEPSQIVPVAAAAVEQHDERCTILGLVGKLEIVGEHGSTQRRE